MVCLKSESSFQLEYQECVELGAQAYTRRQTTGQKKTVKVQTVISLVHTFSWASWTGFPMKHGLCSQEQKQKEGLNQGLANTRSDRRFNFGPQDPVHHRWDFHHLMQKCNFTLHPAPEINSPLPLRWEMLFANGVMPMAGEEHSLCVYLVTPTSTSPVQRLYLSLNWRYTKAGNLSVQFSPSCTPFTSFANGASKIHFLCIIRG